MTPQILLFPSQAPLEGGINFRDQYGFTGRWLDVEYGLGPSQRAAQLAFNPE